MHLMCFCDKLLDLHTEPRFKITTSQDWENAPAKSSVQNGNSKSTCTRVVYISNTADMQSQVACRICGAALARRVTPRGMPEIMQRIAKKQAFELSRNWTGPSKI